MAASSSVIYDGYIVHYSNRLRDNDEVAQALINSEHSWKIYQMSKRIQKKYDKEQ